ncbi:threonine synthase [Oceanicola granulosus HTCC2516]|uniref:Threonine synthase n=1 Tax=Oceanicola granulosus (strain ATCC BAA-861 / DSM 15982 / KCTC 12143 / HTCC2516) TaxID=314256 RepID=Q2CF35_OCEGH|nr:pyridoxal-phosphate dependent enzyme [Oceanicola granulosus]EAR51292.1 threonine synthase [Oceanicola granulosus HTCC2516]
MSTATRDAAPLNGAELECFFCGTRRAPDLLPRCAACGGTLSVAGQGYAAPGADTGIARYRASLPLDGEVVTLGEGGTPLLRLSRLFPDRPVWAKLEFTNPTGSFKDRGSAVAVSAAKALGAEGIVCASTGNNAASVSAYAARAGLPCIVTLGKGTPVAKVLQAKAHGAITVEVAGDFSDAYRMAEEINRADPAWANLTSTYLNPYTTVAHSTILYEVVEEIGAPEAVVVPVGAGPMLDGIVTGARRMQAAGRLETIPRPIGVQGAGCAPIARAFAEGAEEVAAWGEVSGIPGSINDALRGYPEDGTRTLRLIRETAGAAVAVSDDEIRDAMRELGAREGIAAEPASAATLAALRRAPLGELSGPVVLVISGHALKDGPAQPAAADPSIELDTDTGPLEVIERARSRFNANEQAVQGPPDA